jgi:hypothetical protein
MNGLRITLAAGVAAAIACTCFATPARADEQSGLAVGFGIAGAVPFGNAHSAANGVATSSTISMQSMDRASLPFWFNLGWRFSPRTYLGLFYQYAPTFPPSNKCAMPYAPANGVAGSTTCDGSNQKFGVDFAYHIRPKELVDPWIGIGLGYELNNTNYSTGASSDTMNWQLGGLMADIKLGADLRFSKVIPIGPFVDLSVSQYNTENVYSPNQSSTSVPFSGALHGWFTAGLRAQFNL